MKSISICAVLMFCFLSCKNKAATDAQQQAVTLKETIEQLSPGMEPASEKGYYMKATIDGKEWTATGMMHDEGGTSSYRQVNAEGNGTTISFQLWKQGITTGMKRDFGDDYAANFITDDGFFGGRDGGMEITRADDQWIEGKFHFNASSGTSDKKIAVTDGFFRVSAK